MSKEVWRDIEGYEGKYQVSNKGRIKSLNYRRTGKEWVLKPKKRKDGYLMVRLNKEGKEKGYLIHRLVARAFIPNTENYSEINHKDEDKANNAANNLEWCDRSYNNNFGTRNEKVGKSNGKPVMCVETNITYLSAHEAQRKTGIDASGICKCARRDKCYHIVRRYHWKYIEKENK